jgi:hypothetical protein
LCGGNHPATYKGCEHYHNIIRGNNPHRTSPGTPIPTSTAAYNFLPSPYNPPHQQQQQRSYNDVAGNRAPLTEEPITMLKTIFEDFEGLFAQLFHQNSLILNIFTTLLNKQNSNTQSIANSSMERQRPPTT